MPPAFEIHTSETHAGVPILEVRATQPTLLTAEKDLELARQLLELPHESFAVIVDYRNISNASDYGPDDQARTYKSAEFRELRDRAVAMVRYQAASFTSMIQSMRANMLIRSSLYSNFAPDFPTALRFARRAIDQLEAAPEGRSRQAATPPG
jgi:hypothetical protein